MPSTFSLRVNQWLQNPTVLWAWLRATALLLAMSIGLFFVLQSDKVAKISFQKNAVAKLKAKVEEEHTSNIQLKEKTANNNEIIAQIKTRASANTQSTLFTAQELGQRVRFADQAKETSERKRA